MRKIQTVIVVILVLALMCGCKTVKPDEKADNAQASSASTGSDIPTEVPGSESTDDDHTEQNNSSEGGDSASLITAGDDGQPSGLSEAELEEERLRLLYSDTSAEFVHGQVYEQEPIEGLPVYAAVEPKYVGIEGSAEILTPGEAVELSVAVYPCNAYGGLKYESADESVVTVDELGLVTAVGAGTTDITATAANGVSGSCKISVSDNYAELTFELTADGTGYCVTGCSEDAYSVEIPAVYEGLPVKEISGRAFIDCSQLRYFSAAPESEYFYAQGGVLFTDIPVKTLVRMPNYFFDEFSISESYNVPEDTIAIGDYAFAGFAACRFGSYIHLPEGVTTMGDCVFCEIKTQAYIYVPDSLNSIGNDIMIGQESNVPFFGHWDTYASEYAHNYNIPFGGVFDFESHETSAEVYVPENTDADWYEVPSNDRIWFEDIDSYWDDEDRAMQKVSIASSREYDKDEVRIIFETVWANFIPDREGHKRSYMPAMTGVYGMGYTEEPATLVAYSIAGRPLATREVSGEFVFAFEGAVNLGVVGGKEMKLVAFPYEPTYVISGGYINLNPEGWELKTDCSGVRIFITCYEKAGFSGQGPDYLNCISYWETDSTGNYERETDHFRAALLTWLDGELLPLSGMNSIHCDGMQTIFSDENLLCSAKESFGLTEADGKRVNEILSAVKEVMIGKYYPKDCPVSRITVSFNGEFPTSGESKINLDEGCADLDDAIGTITHEMTHAVDQSIAGCDYAAPSPWLEGRAEYISRIVDKKLGYYQYDYAEKYDWSFLTDADKEDFMRYYCFGTNRETTYTVGYYFFDYLNGTYGEDFSGKVMKKLSEEPYSKRQYQNMNQEERCKIFTDCLKAVTSDTVFEDFVRDVVEK